MNVHTQIYRLQKRAIRESRNPGHSKRFINLSPGQLEIFNRALHELAEAGIVRENKLLYLACELSNLDSANLVHHLPVYSLCSKAICRLCVSDQELWLEWSIINSWGEEQVVTNSFQLNESIPVDLLKVDAKEISPTYARKSIQPYLERLKALHDADKAYEIISEAVIQEELWRRSSPILKHGRKILY